jgi:hypothetical protein
VSPSGRSRVELTTLPAQHGDGIRVQQYEPLLVEITPEYVAYIFNRDGFAQAMIFRRDGAAGFKGAPGLNGCKLTDFPGEATKAAVHRLQDGVVKLSVTDSGGTEFTYHAQKNAGTDRHEWKRQ